jgi:hypothetical protein
MGLSKPISREEKPITMKPYRDDPESASGTLIYRATSPNSPVMELEMRPSSTSTRSQIRPPSASNGKGLCRIKLMWIIFVLMIGVYAISRYEAPADDKIQQSIPPSTSNESEGSTSSSKEAGVVDQKESTAQTKSPSTSSICNRGIPFDLFDSSTWPTPYTPSYFEKEPNDSKTAILIRNSDKTISHPNGIVTLNRFFSVLDMAYEKKCQVYITKDAEWFWNVVLTPFFGEAVETNDEFWTEMQDSLDVTILNNEAEAHALGKEFEILVSPNQRFEGGSLTAIQIRNRRDTIFRKLLRMSSARQNVCFTIGLCNLSNVNTPYKVSYAVINLSPSSKNAQSEFDDVSGIDHSGAYQMTPDYVKSILKPLNLHKQTIYMIGNINNLEVKEINRLKEDPELHTFQYYVKEDEDFDRGDMLHLAVLADVFLGEPTNNWSLLIARMRYALGLQNTFVLTEPKIDEDGNEQWVSYVDSENYLELYDREHLGRWMG